MVALLVGIFIIFITCNFINKFLFILIIETTIELRALGLDTSLVRYVWFGMVRLVI